MARTAGRSADETRQLILTSAARLIGRHGTTVPVTDIAEAAGVSKGGLLYHFASKEALETALLERMEQLAREDVAEAFLEGVPVAAAVSGQLELARESGGRLLLRIEDIDGTRSRAEHVETILADLAWLGLEWDGPVVQQSRRLPLYEAALAASGSDDAAGEMTDTTLVVASFRGGISGGTIDSMRVIAEEARNAQSRRLMLNPQALSGGPGEVPRVSLSDEPSDLSIINAKKVDPSLRGTQIRDLKDAAGNAFGEQILRDLGAADTRWQTACLRYFNPVGAHPSGRLGEDPSGVPANLMPFVARVASGAYPELRVFGADFDTRDGSAVRDFIHVMDLAEAHVAGLEWLAARVATGGGTTTRVWNIGRGEGVTVFEMVRAFEAVTGGRIPYRVVERRPGDIAESCAAVDAIGAEVGWHARRDVTAMVRDLWAWQEANPAGFSSRTE